MCPQTIGGKSTHCEVKTQIKTEREKRKIEEPLDFQEKITHNVLSWYFSMLPNQKIKKIQSAA